MNKKTHLIAVLYAVFVLTSFFASYSFLRSISNSSSLSVVELNIEKPTINGSVLECVNNDFVSSLTDNKKFPEGERIEQNDLFYGPTYNPSSPISSDSLHISPVNGNVTWLVIPVDFSDQHSVTINTTIDSRWDASSDSVQDYYLENSYNQLNITVDTRSWIQAPNPIGFYAIGMADYTKESELWNWAISYWDTIINFNQYDMIFIIYSGEDDTNDTAFWPHVWWGVDVHTNDGISYYRIGFAGEMSGMGTYAHESGHGLGLIDYYNQGTAPNGYYYCGRWELMDMGNYNLSTTTPSPSHLSAYSRISLGWIKNSQILTLNEGNIGTFRLYQLESANLPNGLFYAVKIPVDTLHYYLIEFRDNIGYDTALPDYGALWSYVNETAVRDGRLTYIGGNHYSIDLDGVELDDNETVNNDNFCNWLTGNFELSIAAIDQGPNYMEIVVNCYNDFGIEWDTYSNLPFGNLVTMDFPSLQAGDILAFYWAAPAGFLGSDFNLRRYNGGAWTLIADKPNIYQDGFVYRIMIQDTYQVEIVNDDTNGSMDVYYKYFVGSKPINSLMNIQPNIVWKNGDYTANFTVSIDVSNSGTSWDDNGFIQVQYPGNITLDITQSAIKPWYTAYGNSRTKFSWDFSSNGMGDLSMNFTLNATWSNATYQTVIHFDYDYTAPVVDFTEKESKIYCNSTYDFHWTGSDSQSGIQRFLLNRNGSYWGQMNSTTFTYKFEFQNTDKEGNYEFQIIAYDQFYSNLDTIEMVYDKTPPNASLFSSDTTKGTNYTLTLSVEDIFSGIKDVDVYINNTFVRKAQIEGKFATISFNAENYFTNNNKTLFLRFYCYDKAGNLYLISYLIKPKWWTSNILFYVGIGVTAVIGIIILLVIINKKKL